MQSEARDEVYDVVVVGGGLGGLSAAAFLTRAGKKVLLVERTDGPGGYARAFQRGPYTFDPAIHVIPQGVGRILDVMIQILGIQDRVTLLPVDSFYAAVFPGLHLHTPATREAYIDAHIRHFPAEEQGFRAFLDLCDRITWESQQLPQQLSLHELEQAVEQFPTLFRYRSVTLGEVLDEYLTDPRLKALCTAPWPYMGLPPSRLSFFTWAAMMSSFLEAGSFYCQGSFQRLVDALVWVIEHHGSELIVSNAAERILVQDGRVTGVVLQGGQIVQAPVVVSNADATETFETLVAAEHLPAPFLRRLKRLQTSFSAFALYAATGVDLHQFDAAHETFVSRHWDHDASYQDILQGRTGGVWINIPTLVDPSLAPPGEHILIVSALAPFELGAPWEHEKNRYTGALLDQLNAVLPGVADKLTYMESATPLALERYTANRRGAIYGWDNTPGQAGSQRPNNQTPIEGLYLSGHWTQPGTGSLRVTYSGFLTAQIALGCSGIDDYMRVVASGAR